MAVFTMERPVRFGSNNRTAGSVRFRTAMLWSVCVSVCLCVCARALKEATNRALRVGTEPTRMSGYLTQTEPAFPL